MERTVEVFLDTPEAPVPVGTLWPRSRQGVESATFTYHPDWLAREARFPLSPELPLTAGPHHTPPGRALFGALADSAPDLELARRGRRGRG